MTTMSAYADPGNPYIVTPSDTADLPIPAKFILVANTTTGTACTFKVNTPGGAGQTFTLPAGQYFWAPVTRVWSTGLTAGTTITAFY